MRSGVRIVERFIEAHSAGLIALGMLLGMTVNRKWLLLPASDAKLEAVRHSKGLARQTRNNRWLKIVKRDRFPLIHFSFVLRAGQERLQPQKAELVNIFPPKYILRASTTESRVVGV